MGYLHVSHLASSLFSSYPRVTSMYPILPAVFSLRTHESHPCFPSCQQSFLFVPTSHIYVSHLDSSLFSSYPRVTSMYPILPAVFSLRTHESHPCFPSCQQSFLFVPTSHIQRCRSMLPLRIISVSPFYNFATWLHHAGFCIIVCLHNLVPYAHRLRDHLLNFLCSRAGSETKRGVGCYPGR
jgi:hypothetical protein